MNYNPFCFTLFSWLEKSTIRYCVLRNYHNLPNSTSGSDLDIWVHEEDVEGFIGILEKVSKQTCCSLVSYIPDKNCPKFCYLGFNGGIQIDLFKGNIYCQNKVIVSQEIVIDHIEDYHGISIMDDIFADLIAFLKEVVNNGACKEKYIESLTRHIDNYDGEYLRNNLAQFPRRFIDELSNCLNNIDNIKGEIPRLSISARRSLGIKLSIIKKFLKFDRFFSAPGYVLSIIGTDGSGKSTVINSITPILNEAFHNGVDYYHLRPHWLPDLGVLLGKREADKGGNVVSHPHGSKPSGVLMSLFRWAYYLIDYSIGYMRKVWLTKYSKSHVVLFDRYYYDYYIDPHRLKASIPCWLVRIGEFLVPSPDIILCLGGDPEKIYSRKPETSIEEVTRQVVCLQYFCSKRKNTVWIDTTQDLNASINETMMAIKNMMERRFSKVVAK